MKGRSRVMNQNYTLHTLSSSALARLWAVSEPQQSSKPNHNLQLRQQQGTTIYHEGSKQSRSLRHGHHRRVSLFFSLLVYSIHYKHY